MKLNSMGRVMDIVGIRMRTSAGPSYISIRI